MTGRLGSAILIPMSDEQITRKPAADLHVGDTILRPVGYGLYRLTVAAKMTFDGKVEIVGDQTFTHSGNTHRTGEARITFGVTDLVEVAL